MLPTPSRLNCGLKLLLWFTTFAQLAANLSSEFPRKIFLGN
jgi:hypothetical protein